MSRIQFITIDGKPYRWKGILALRRLQRCKRQARDPTAVVCIALRRQPTSHRPDCVRRYQ